jgi:hypothetical protein
MVDVNAAFGGIDCHDSGFHASMDGLKATIYGFQATHGRAICI